MLPWLIAHGGGDGVTTRTTLDPDGVLIVVLIVVSGVALVGGATIYVRRRGRSVEQAMPLATIAIVAGLGTLTVAGVSFESLAYREERVAERPVEASVQGDARVKIRFVSATESGNAHLTALNQGIRQRVVSCELEGLSADGEPATEVRKPFVALLKPRVAQQFDARLEVVASIARMVAHCEGWPVDSPTSGGDRASERSGARDGIMPSLCRVRDLAREGGSKAYDTYSSSVMSLLHALMNDLQDADPAQARALIRAENAMEISLLGEGAPSRERLASVKRVMRVARPELERFGLTATC